MTEQELDRILNEYFEWGMAVQRIQGQERRTDSDELTTIAKRCQQLRQKALSKPQRRT